MQDDANNEVLNQIALAEQAADDQRAEDEAAMAVRSDTPPISTPDDPMTEQVKLTFLSNSKGATIEVAIPNGADMNEKNMLHVLAWYITNAFGQLLPVAINSWHAQRLAMLQKGPEGAAYGQLPGVPDEAPNDPPGDEGTESPTPGIIGANGPKLLGPDARPIGG
jgi:hypothetical protein